MATNDITIREWIENFENGEYEANDFHTQVRAGWFDWFCKTSSLATKTRKIGNIIKGIKSDYIKDNYRCWFKHNAWALGGSYSDFRFEPLDDAKRNNLYFGVTIDDGKSDHKYTIFTARNDYKTEFYADNKRQLLKIIEVLAVELEAADKAFDAEKAAA